MACRGVHFAITPEQARRLLTARGDDELVGLVERELEEPWEEANLFESDHGWDALHRALSDGTLRLGAGMSPLGQCFFGGRTLNTTAGYYVVLLTPEEVQGVAAALALVTEPMLRRRYFGQSFPDYQGTKSEADWRYAWSCFQGLPAFFARAAHGGRAVIFTVEQ